MSTTVRRAIVNVRRCFVWTCLCLAWPTIVLAAPKTDVLVLVNGDRLTGEIKSLTQGKLKFKTDATGTIEVEWLYVAGLQTRQHLEVELSSGARYLGQAPPGAAAGSIRIAVGEEDPGREVPLDSVVRIDTIAQGDLLDRLDGYVTGGYDYTKASGVKSLNVTAGISSRTPVRRWALDSSWTNTSVEQQPDSMRYDLSFNNRRFHANRRFIQGFASAEGNDELGLDLRSTLGAAYGIYFRQTPSDEWYGALGLAGIRENFASQASDESIEAVLTTGYTYFRFVDPEANLDASISLFPSLTRSGRVRSEGQVRARFELVTDLFFELSMYGSFDSDPDAEANSNSDYGITTSLGYSF
jgi:hypothetical protein